MNVTMIADRLIILNALTPLTGTEEAWVNVIGQWPGDTREEGVAFWHLLQPSASTGPGSLNVYQALQQKFGVALWDDSTLPMHPTEAMWQATAGLKERKDSYSSNLKPMFDIFNFFLDGASASACHAAQKRGVWAPHMFGWLSRASEEVDRKGQVVHRLFAEGWLAQDATWKGQPLAPLLRHASDIRGWLKGGGNPNQIGLDAQHPDRPLWFIWHKANAHLRDVILALVPEAKSLRDEPSPASALVLEGKLEKIARASGKTAAATWWETLTSDPDWSLLRSRKTQAPLWLAALSACPALLSHVCERASWDVTFRAHLGDKDAQGHGFWEAALHHVASRSFTLPLLKKMHQWVSLDAMQPWWKTLSREARTSRWDNPLGSSYSVYVKDYAENDLVHQMLTPSMLLGTPDQQHELVTQWTSHRDAWKAIAEHAAVFKKALVPEGWAVSAVVTACQSLEWALRAQNGSQKAGWEEPVKAAIDVIMGLPLTTPLPQGICEHINAIKVNSAKTRSLETIEGMAGMEVVAQLELAVKAAERVRRATAKPIAPSGSVRKRYRG